MKINLVKTAVGSFVCADDEAYEKASNMKAGEAYEVNIKLNQNWRLHKKMFAFFNYCAQHYFGDQDVDRDKVDYTRRQLTIAAGYEKTLVDPRTGFIEITAKSLSYQQMPPEERSKCYKKLVNAACENVFHTADEATWNKLISFF